VREDRPGDKRLVAYVVGHDGAGVDVTVLAGHAGGRLPDYMVPSAFVVLDGLPITGNGKLDRRALPEPVLGRSSVYRPPVTMQQETLCSLFGNALGIAQVGVDDSFFDLGGQSLSGIRLVNTINEALGAELSLDQLFDFPTVTEIDRCLRE